MSAKILVINPGSTSTKIAVYESENPVMVRNIPHSTEELKQRSQGTGLAILDTRCKRMQSHSGSLLSVNWKDTESERTSTKARAYRTTDAGDSERD